MVNWQEPCRGCGWPLSWHQLPASPDVKNAWARCPAPQVSRALYMASCGKPAEGVTLDALPPNVETSGPRAGKVRPNGNARWHSMLFLRPYPESTIRAAVAELRCFTAVIPAN